MMVMLARLIKTVLSAARLNKAVRSAFIVGLIRSVSWIFRPSTLSRIKVFITNLVKSTPGSIRPNILSSLFKGAAELLLLRFAKRGGVSGAAALSALAALLLGMMRGQEDSSGPRRKKQKDQIIDLDEYTVVDERH
jgi:hypothetical protein